MDPLNGAQENAQEISEDLSSGDGLEALSDSMIAVFSPIPFTSIDDDFLDEFEDLIEDEVKELW